MIPVFDVTQDSFSYGVSNGGTTVVGSLRPNGIEEWAMIWHPTTGYSRLPGFEDTAFSRARDTSADGSVVVGGAGTEAFRWTSAGGRVGLGDLPGGDQLSQATAVSVDGSVVVGYSYSSSGLEAFRWTYSEGIIGLGKLSPADRNTFANNTSADGSVVVGWVQTDTDISKSFRWTEGSGMISLGSMSGFEDGSGASAVSGDGSVIVGGASHEYDEAAYVWDQIHGMRNLHTVLADMYGLGPSLIGWTLTGASDISTDGLTIVGGGLNPDGNWEAWLVRLDHPITTPEPQSATLVALGAATLLTRRRLRRKYIIRH
jgi:probable HAF family extracellular repeat protein